MEKTIKDRNAYETFVAFAMIFSAPIGFFIGTMLVDSVNIYDPEGMVIDKLVYFLGIIIGSLALWYYFLLEKGEKTSLTFVQPVKGSLAELIQDAFEKGRYIHIPLEAAGSVYLPKKFKWYIKNSAIITFLLSAGYFTPIILNTDSAILNLIAVIATFASSTIVGLISALALFVKFEKGGFLATPSMTLWLEEEDLERLRKKKSDYKNTEDLL